VWRARLSCGHHGRAYLYAEVQVTNEQDELRSALYHMLGDLKPMAERNPGATVHAGDFDALLATAKRLFPGSTTLMQLSPLGQDTTAG
jgi:hypothetical protein